MSGEQTKLQENQSKKNSVFISGLAGGIAGVTVDIIYYPFETLKTRIQASNKKVDYSQKAKNLDKYKGFSMQMLSSFPFAFLFFYSYDEVKKLLGNTNFISNNQTSNVSTENSFKNFIAAAVAETIANVTRTPFEVVKQQQQVGHDKLVRHTIQAIYSTKGLKGFYAGFGPLLFRDIPFSGIQLPLYEYMKKGKQRDLTIFESIYSGAVAASVAAFLTTPMDVVKSKMMTQRDSYYKNSLHCTQLVFKEEGAQAFFKGTAYRTFPLAFTGTIFFTAYEQAKNVLYSFQDKY